MIFSFFNLYPPSFLIYTELFFFRKIYLGQLLPGINVSTYTTGLALGASHSTAYWVNLFHSFYCHIHLREKVKMFTELLNGYV